MRVLLAVAFCVLLVPTAQSKCPFRCLRVSGIVVDNGGAPVPDALVGMAWTQDKRLAGPALARTDSDGKYVITIRIETYSAQSLLGGDKCKSRIDGVSVTASGEEFRSEHETLAVGEAEELQVRPLRLDVPIEEAR